MSWPWAEMFAAGAGALFSPLLGRIVSRVFVAGETAEALRERLTQEISDAIARVNAASQEYWGSESAVSAETQMKLGAQVVAGMHHVNVLFNELFANETDLSNCRANWMAANRILTGGTFLEPDAQVDARQLAAMSMCLINLERTILKARHKLKRPIFS